ncbi:Fanconi anemia group D2 protein [Coemansia sp. RSA 2337]|nr:Fanconi anemia group D2 protein [Coemansia sp. RSA 2337]
MESSLRCKELIRGCGLELTEGRLPTLHTSTALFRFKLGEAIRGDAETLELLGNFVEELLSDHDNISLYLDPVVLATGEDNSDNSPSSSRLAHFGSGQSESLVRLMLGVDALQPRIISILLEKFPEFIGNEGAHGSAGTTQPSVKILRQLRWLDYVIDSAGLTEKLIETLGYVTPEMQSEIISALPDIISDSDSTGVSVVLAGMMDETPALMLPILEALGSLECSMNLLDRARSSVVTCLVSADPAELPVMVRFLLQSVSSEAAPPLIQRIRGRLNMKAVLFTAKQRSRANDHGAPDVLIFDVIATCLRSHRHLRDAWLKIIVNDTAPVGPHTTLDFVVLLILHQITTHTKRVESALRSKIDAVSSQPIAYTPKLLKSIISYFPSVFSAHFPALLSIASWLIRSSPLGSQGSRVASAMVVSAFGAMGMFQRQEISGELAVHIGSGNANEVDTAARTCLQLAQEYPRELRPFAVFIKGLLDYVDNLSIEHMRVIFDVLGILSTLDVGGGSDGDSMFNDLYIFVRKQLSSVYPKYNRIGIVGTVSLLRQLGAQDCAAGAGGPDVAMAGSSSQSQTLTANVQALRRAVQLLEMLMDSGRHQSWAFLSMTYDELAHIVETQGLHVQLLTWLHENVSSTFADQFLGDSDRMAERYLLAAPPSVALSLDDEESTILDIFNHNGDATALGLDRVAKRTDMPEEVTASPKLRGSLLSCLPSLLRLVQVCEKALSAGSLAEIDALLVCGMYLLPPVDVSDDLPAHITSSPSAFSLANGVENSTSALISGNLLVGASEEERRELMDRIKFWPPELRRVFCTSLFVAVNWVREVINAFADQPLAEIRGKVVQRVNQLANIERDLASVAETLKGTLHEFRPMLAGLVPDASDAPVVRSTAVVGGLTLRSPRPDGDDAAMQVDNEADDDDVPKSARSTSYTVDIGGLLLSQDDTRKFVDDQDGLQDGTIAKGKKRGRKPKSTGGAASSTSTDDATRDSYLLLRELSFSAYGVFNICTGCGGDSSDDGDGGGQPQAMLSSHGLSMLLRELSAVVSTKLVRHTERRLPWLKQPTGGHGGALATFGSTIAGSSASDIAQKLLPVFPSLLRYLTSCLVTRAHFRNDVEVPNHAVECRHLISGVDELDDVDMIETCIDTLLQIISSVLYWDGLQNDSSKATESSDNGQQVTSSGFDERDSMLLAVLGALAIEGRHTDQDELADIETSVLVRRAFDYLLGLADLVGNSGSALCILRMLVAMRSFSPHTELREEMRDMDAQQRSDTMDGRISNLASQILSAKWAQSADLKPGDLEYVITQHIMRCPHDRLQLTYKYATKTLNSFSTRPGQSDDSFATLKPTTFATYYKAVTQALALNVKQAWLNEMSGPEIIAFSKIIATSWLTLTDITKKVEGTTLRSILFVALRGGSALVDQITKIMLPQLDKYLLVHRDDIVELLSRVQKSTRALQTICNHSKVAKDTKLQSGVPQVKRKLEQFLFHVIALMENNNCKGAVSTGNLKHRDIRGECVSSQIPRSQNTTDEESDEPMDDLGIDLSADPDGSNAEEASEDGSDEDRGSNRRQQPQARQYASRSRGRGRGSSGVSDRPPQMPRPMIKQKERVRNQKLLMQRRSAAHEQFEHEDRHEE